MKKKSVLFVWLLFLIPLSGATVELERSFLQNEVQSLKYATTVHVYTGVQDEPPVDEFDIGFGEDESIYEYDFKSPKRAFVYSLLIPGWGQKYAKSNVLKPLFFIAAEAGLWMGYFKNKNNGNKKTDDFENWADSLWHQGLKDTSYYTQWLFERWGEIDDNEITSDSITHHLPDVHDQEYYEMIGKYDQFRAGWEDYWLDPYKYDSVNFYTSPQRETYLGMRKDANDFYNNANRFLIFSVLNHLVSAFDAALAARRYNRGQTSDAWLSVKTEMKKYSATENLPIIKLTYRF